MKSHSTWRWLGSGLSLVVGLLMVSAVPAQAGAVRALPGFGTNTLPANDDGSTALVPLGFTMSFFGTNFFACYVNNNGNITFDQPLSTFTPFGLTSTVAQIVAPYFADVDTRGAGSGLVTYGNDVVDGHNAFGVDWINVGYYFEATDKLNSFELVLIDRADVSPGATDMEFNYNQIQWETGDASDGNDGLGGFSARAGFSNGSLQPGTYFEISGSAVNGAFLDSNPTGLIHREFNSTVLGRFLFPVRNGTINISGLTFDMGVDQDPVGIGSNLTYTITISSSGITPVLGMQLTDQLPSGIAFVGETTSQGSCTFANGILQCSLGDLPGAGTINVTLTGTAELVGDFCNSAQLTTTNGASLSAQACSSVIPSCAGGCVTRPSRYWFTHVQSDDPLCATLLGAINANNSNLDLGFLILPIQNENSDNVVDGADALIEALGLYWRSAGYTGDNNGTQNAKFPSSTLCKARKALAVEIISAIANFTYLGSCPNTCSYHNGGTVTNFPIDIVEQARAACAGEDVTAIRTETALLRLFNSSGETNNFPGGLLECTANKTSLLREVARDPTTKLGCPGLNDLCETALAIMTFPYKQTVNLTKYTAGFSQIPSCGSGGANAVWKIEQPFAAPGRQFLIRTTGSNIPTLVSVWEGSNCSNLTQVACSTMTANLGNSSGLLFTTDGTNTFYIVGEGQNGAVGSLKLNISSF